MRKLRKQMDRDWEMGSIQAEFELLWEARSAVLWLLDQNDALEEELSAYRAAEEKKTAIEKLRGTFERDET